MPRTEAGLQRTATSHRVSLRRNPPLSEEDRLLIEAGEIDPDETEHRAGHPTGAWLVFCERCDEIWEPTLGPSGRPVGEWWLCPNWCNLSERRANRIIVQSREGTREVDESLLYVCLDKLGRLSRPKSRQTIGNTCVNPREVASAEWIREMDRHSSEWTPEMNRRWEEFD